MCQGNFHTHKIKATTFADSAADVDANVTTTWQTSKQGDVDVTGEICFVAYEKPHIILNIYTICILK